MSLRPSRIHRIRKRGAWRRQFRLDGDACPSELSRLPAGLDEEDEDRGACDRPGRAEEAAVVDAASSARQTDSGGDRDVPVKLRHLKVAAERGHLEAMYLLAQECDDRRRADPLADDGRRARARARHARPGNGVRRLARAPPLAAASRPSKAGPKPWPNWATWNARERGGNGTRIPEWQNGSRHRCAAAGIEVLIGASPGRIESSRQDVGLDLAIPIIGQVFLKPLRKTPQTPRQAKRRQPIEVLLCSR